jgi:PAS domain-containing protein
MLESPVQPVDTLSILNSIPGNHLILLPDAPKFTIVGATDAYLDITYTHRETIIGKAIFDVFKDNPETIEATGVKSPYRLFFFVLEHKKEDKMKDHWYALLNPGSGQYEKKVWRLTNRPVLDNSRKVQYIIHTAEDITDLVKSNQREEKVKGIEQAHSLLMQGANLYSYDKGHDLVIEMANDPTLQYWGRGKEVVGQRLMDALPELEGQGFDEFLREVLRTGETKEFTRRRLRYNETGKKKYTISILLTSHTTRKAILKQSGLFVFLWKFLIRFWQKRSSKKVKQNIAGCLSQWTRVYV